MGRPVIPWMPWEPEGEENVGVVTGGDTVRVTVEAASPSQYDWDAWLLAKA